MSNYIKAAAKCDPHLLKKAQYNEHEAATTFLRDPTSSFLEKKDDGSPSAPPLPPYCVYRTDHRLQQLSTYDQLTIRKAIQQRADVEAANACGYGRPGRHLVNKHDPIKGVRLAEGGASKDVNLWAPRKIESLETYKSERPPALAKAATEENGVVDELFSGRRSPFARHRLNSANNSPTRAGGARRTVAAVLAAAHAQQQQQQMSDGPTLPPINDTSSSCYGRAIPTIASSAAADHAKQRAIMGSSSSSSDINAPMPQSLTAAEAAEMRRKLLRVAKMDALHASYRQGIMGECEPSRVAPRPYRTLSEPWQLE